MTRREGKNSIRRAKLSTGPIQFYENLFRALLTFQASLVSYKAINDLGLNVPGVWNEINMSQEEVEQCWVECEEMRVAILVSILKSAVPSYDGPDLTNPDDFFGFWEAQLEKTVNILYKK
jgi:hypothetical protein